MHGAFCAEGFHVSLKRGQLESRRRFCPFGTEIRMKCSCGMQHKGIRFGPFLENESLKTVLGDKGE